MNVIRPLLNVSKKALLEDLSNNLLDNQYSTMMVRLIVKLRLLSFKVGIVNYPKPLYYIIRFLYKYGLPSC